MNGNNNNAINSDLFFNDVLYQDELLFNNNNNAINSSVMPPTAAPALAGVTEFNAAIGADHQLQAFQFQSHQGGGSTKSHQRQYSTRHQNVLERRRKQKIKLKLEQLHHMIPNSIPTYKSSMLDNVIGYLQTLRNQRDEMMSIQANNYYNHMEMLGHPYIPIVGQNPFDLGQVGTEMNNNPPWAPSMVIDPNQDPTMFNPVAPFLPPSPPPQP